MLDAINPHVVKILLAMEEGDSIKRISRKTGSSYGWTHKWVVQLEELGVLERDRGVRLRDEELFNRFLSLAKSVLSRKMELGDYYMLPNFSGLKYSYTKTDAVFIWTKGGYQIGRSRKNYPIFINVLDKDSEDWRSFFREFSVNCNIQERLDRGIHYVMFPQDNFEVEWVGSTPVTPLHETVDWAGKYKYNFQPALEMLDEMYGLDLDIKYRERVST